MDGRRRLVDLDERRPASDQPAISAARIGTNASAAASRCGRPGPAEMSRPDSVNGPGSVTLSGRVVAGRGVPELLDHPQPVGRGDRLEDFEAVLLVVAAGAQPAFRLGRPEPGQVAVELRREEAGAAHLAVGDDVDPGLLLVTDRGVDRVVERLGEVGRTELAARWAAIAATSQDGWAYEPTTLVGRRPGHAAPPGSIRTVGNKVLPAGPPPAERERAGRVVDEQVALALRRRCRDRHRVGELPEQPGQPRATAVGRASSRGAPRPSRASIRSPIAVLDRPLEQGERPVVDAGVPAEDPGRTRRRRRSRGSRDGRRGRPPCRCASSDHVLAHADARSASDLLAGRPSLPRSG